MRETFDPWKEEIFPNKPKEPLWLSILGWAAFVLLFWGAWSWIGGQ